MTSRVIAAEAAQAAISQAMSSGLLADKSALEWTRRDKRARAAFLSLRTVHVIVACPHDSPGDLLLRRSAAARNQADLEALPGGQRALQWLPVNEAVMDRALEVQRLLAAHSGTGHRRPVPDLIIAATAELHGAEVMHVDSDYDMIARVTDQPVWRLFDPGSA